MDDNHFKVGEFASPKNKIFPSLVLFIIIEGNVSPLGEGVRMSSSKFWDECHHYRKDDRSSSGENRIAGSVQQPEPIPLDERDDGFGKGKEFL